MEPPINHPDAFNPGLAGPDFDGLSFSVGHVDHPGVVVPIEPYTDRHAAYYGACDPLTALRDSAVEALVRNALVHVRRAFPEYFPDAGDPAAEAPAEGVPHGYDPDALLRLDRLRKLVTDAAAYPLRPLFVHLNRTVPLSAYRGDPDNRLVTECQMFCAGRFEHPGAKMLYPEPPWEEDWYEHCRSLFPGHDATHCWTSDGGDCYLVYQVHQHQQQNPSPATEPVAPLGELPSYGSSAAQAPCQVAVVRHQPSRHTRKSFASVPLVIEKIAGVGSLDEAAGAIVASARLALVADLLDVAHQCGAATEQLQPLMEHPRSILVQKALTEHLDHRALDYHGPPQRWGSFGISAVNAEGPFVACEPVVGLDPAGPELGL